MKKETENLAPIVLFVYNRPGHTLQTLEALSQNRLAPESVLFIYADGPKSSMAQEQLNQLHKVREIAKSKHWCGKVEVIERKKNLGLAENIVSGVTEIVNQYGKVIVLEDDIVTSPGFLQYMNDALTLYENEDKVMHVSGYMFPVEENLPETFFYNTASCWGWGTWSSAWKHLDMNAKYLLEEIKSKGLLHQFNLEGGYSFENQLKANIEGKIKTWAVKWYASMMLKGGHALHPYPSLVNNIGHDGAGENCGITSYYTWNTLATSIPVKKKLIKENAIARKAMFDFYQTMKMKKRNKKSNLKNSLRKKAKLFLPPIVTTFISHLRKPKNKIALQEERELERISKIPRFHRGSTNLMNGHIKFVDSASFNFIYNEVFKKEIYKFNAVTKSPYIIDAGANIGLGVIYFKSLYPDAEIVAFEPDEEVFDVLKYNIDAFGFQKVQLIKKGLWDCETTLKFYAEGADAGRVALSTDEDKLIKIKTERLVSYLSREVNFLKIDIEGAEYEVLKDCRELLKNVANLFVEYHSFIDKDQKIDEILSIIKQAGFRIFVSTSSKQDSQPLINRYSYAGMDMRMNIYGYRL